MAAKMRIVDHHPLGTRDAEKEISGDRVRFILPTGGPSGDFFEVKPDGKGGIEIRGVGRTNSDRLKVVMDCANTIYVRFEEPRRGK